MMPNVYTPVHSRRVRNLRFESGRWHISELGLEARCSTCKQFWPANVKPAMRKRGADMRIKNVADIIDMANDRAQAELDAAIAACVGSVSTSESAIWCEECDVEIPEKRRELIRGCKLCVQCQGMAEQKRRGFKNVFN